MRQLHLLLHLELHGQNHRLNMVKSINRLNELINNKLDGSYGLGIDRDLKDYEYISGVDLINKKVVDETKAFTADFIKSLSWKESPFK